MECGVLFMEIWNKINFLSRDRYGKKPLYYYNQSLFIASSEIKSIYSYLDLKHREINPYYLADFFTQNLMIILLIKLFIRT